MISRYLTLTGIPVNQMTLFTEIQTLIIYLAENVGSLGLPSVAGKGLGSLYLKSLNYDTDDDTVQPKFKIFRYNLNKL